VGFGGVGGVGGVNYLFGEGAGRDGCCAGGQVDCYAVQGTQVDDEVGFAIELLQGR